MRAIAISSLPEGYKADESRKWPLIVLHGAGERGANLEMLKKHGPPKLIAAGQKFEAIVASLQCLPGQIWNPRCEGADGPSHQVAARRCRSRLSHRPEHGRLCDLGDCAGYPDTYAAIVPICGGAGVRFVMAERIKHLPVWIFHGAKDPVVEPAYSQKMYDALKKKSAAM